LPFLREKKTDLISPNKEGNKKKLFYCFNYFFGFFLLSFCPGFCCFHFVLAFVSKCRQQKAWRYIFPLFQFDISIIKLDDDEHERSQTLAVFMNY
jgi:hypothetical protein